MALGLFDDEEIRRCAHPGCITVLSIYNGGTLCWVHEPRRLYLVQREPEFGKVFNKIGHIHGSTEERRFEVRLCSEQPCPNEAHARGLCMNHYKQWEHRTKTAAGLIRRKGRWVQRG